MASESEQHTASRRRARGITNTGSYNPDTSVYQKPMLRADTSTSPHTTDGYRFDEGMIDPPRSNSSVVRFNSTTNTPRLTGSQPIPSAVPPRRQSMTRDFPSPTSSQNMRPTSSQGIRSTSSHGIRQTSSQPQSQMNRQTRQPRLAGTGPQTAYPNPQTLKQTRPPKQQEEKPRRRVHWLLPVGIGMIAMLVLWIVGSNVLAWGTLQYNNIVYGMPRTYQTNAVVGQGGDSAQHPSHFIAINLNHQAVIIELMAGDPSKSVSYKANFLTTSSNDDLAPITLQFKDVNGDKKPDMIVNIHLPGQDQVVIFINTGKQFRPLQSTDKLTNY
jgi:hypothetical protein